MFGRQGTRASAACHRGEHAQITKGLAGVVVKSRPRFVPVAVIANPMVPVGEISHVLWLSGEKVVPAWSGGRNRRSP